MQTMCYKVLVRKKGAEMKDKNTKCMIHQNLVPLGGGVIHGSGGGEGPNIDPANSSSLLPSLFVYADEPRTSIAGSLRAIDSGVVKDVNMVSATNGGRSRHKRTADSSMNVLTRSWVVMGTRRISPEFRPYAPRLARRLQLAANEVEHQGEDDQSDDSAQDARQYFDDLHGICGRGGRVLGPW